MTRTISMGSDASRDYSNFTEFFADWGVGLPDGPKDESDPWVLELYNDDGTAISIGTRILNAYATSAQMDATYTLTVRPASGNGAAGHPNDIRTNDKLQYDPSKGAALTNGAVELMNYTSSDAYWFWEGVQFGGSNYQFNRAPILARGRVNLKDCIIYSHAHSSYGAIGLMLTGTWAGLIENLAVVIDGGSTTLLNRGISHGFLNDTIRGLTIVQLDSSPAAGSTRTGIYRTNHAGPNFTSALILGFAVSYTSDGDVDDAPTYIYSDAAESGLTLDGTSNTGLTATDEIEDMTSLASHNLKLKSGATSRDVGVVGGPSTDFFGTTRDANPDVGAYEYVSGGGGTIIPIGVYSAVVQQNIFSVPDTVLIGVYSAVHNGLDLAVFEQLLIDTQVWLHSGKGLSVEERVSILTQQYVHAGQNLLVQDTDLVSVSVQNYMALEKDLVVTGGVIVPILVQRWLVTGLNLLDARQLFRLLGAYRGIIRPGAVRYMVGRTERE